MRLLLDTHIALWALADDRRLTTDARAAIADPDNDVWVSAVSVWEIAIKHARAQRHPVFGHSRTRLLSTSRLPASRHQARTRRRSRVLADAARRPVDRLLIAQAVTEPLRLLTHDHVLGAWSDTVILV